MTQTKIKTSDYSSEDSPDQRIKTTSRAFEMMGGQQSETRTESKTTTTVITNTKTIGGHRAGSVATSTPKASNFVTSYASQFTSRAGGGGVRGGGGGGGSVAASASASTESRQFEKRTIKEHTQNVLNSEKELSKNKTHLSGFLGNSFVGDRSLNLDSSDHVAYLEYKKAGEYWK